MQSGRIEKSQVSCYAEHLRQKRLQADVKEFQPLSISRLTFNQNYSVDFFSIERVWGGYGYFVSDKLQKALENNKCSGMIFVDPNERYPK